METLEGLSIAFLNRFGNVSETNWKRYAAASQSLFPLHTHLLAHQLFTCPILPTATHGKPQRLTVYTQLNGTARDSSPTRSLST